MLLSRARRKNICFVNLCDSEQSMALYYNIVTLVMARILCPAYNPAQNIDFAHSIVLSLVHIVFMCVCEF